MNNYLSETDTKVVLDILIEKLEVEKDQLIPDARLHQDLGADSLTVMEIMLALEEQFDLVIPDEQLERTSTVQDVFEALADVLGKQSQRRASHVE